MLPPLVVALLLDEPEEKKEEYSEEDVELEDLSGVRYVVSTDKRPFGVKVSLRKEPDLSALT